MRTILFHQITSLGTARGLGYGLSKVASAAIAAKGSGYKAGDKVTVAGGTMPVASTFRVMTVDSSGGVLTLDKIAAGVATTKPSNAAATTGGTGSGLTLNLTWEDDAVPDGASAARITAEAQTCRWRDDGTSPTSGIGHVLLVSTPITLGDLGALASVKVIEQTGGAKLNVSLHGP
jgi:hypothetical protein